ncbi:uncharacterized protein LOC142332527 [Lycorma delicatula]|uniref:uncharacterized protein LOC142332527 n=1 Tax=Lycorma delicatula TaxID=130591 RepID=UPI003F517A15
MIKVDENDPVGELQPSFPYRDVSIKRNVDMKEYYDLETEIGRGKFGTVYRCKEKSTGLTLAAKFVGIARRQDRRNVEREVEIMRTLQHPRLIQLYDAFETNNVMCVIQELIEGGELFERVIDDDFILTEKACTVFMRQICEGVEFVHSQNILHLDLKPENILCLTKTGNRIKIIDFGLARKFEPDKKLQVLFGTPEFVAPEVVNFEQIGFGTDMWSVGVICYVLLSGLSPFMGETDVETMANVTIAQYDFDDEAFDDISDDAKNFITKLLMKNKEHRLTATECLSHVWLRRKPPPPPPPQQPQLLQNIQPNLQQTNDLLDNTKENLRDFVDRWSENNVSPSKVISVPNNEPLKQIIINQPLFVNDINKTLNLIKSDNNNDTSVVKMDIESNPTNINTEATQINNNESQPGKKLKLDTSISNNSNHISTSDNNTTSATRVSTNVKFDTINKDISLNKSQPTSPVGTIPKTTLNNSKIKSNTNEYTGVIKDLSADSSALRFPTELNNEITKNPSLDQKVDVKQLILDSKEESLNNNNDNLSTSSDVFKPIQQLPPLDPVKNINKSNSGGMLLNKTTDKKFDIDINKLLPPQIPVASGQKPKFTHQFSVPNDLSKCTLNKNIPTTDNIKQPKENSNFINNSANKLSKENNSSRSDIKNSLNQTGDSNKESDFKFNKTLNKHVPPKIHGIVLGQSNDNETNDSVSSVSDKKGPKVITHKIIVEGRSEPVVPQSVSSSFVNNKENKKNDNRIPKPLSKSQTSSKLELKDSSNDFKNRPFFNKFLENDRFDRRGSDISCFLHNSENLERINFADEIKKLSSRLFQMGNSNNNNNNNSNTTSEGSENDIIHHQIPLTSYRNDPIGKFLANHGVVTRRPKYRVSYLNRDVPIGSPPPPSNLFYHLSHSNSDNWSDNQTHSAPQSPSVSPERETGNLTKEVILRLFDKSNANSPSALKKQEDEQHSTISSIDSLASYFKTNNETKKNIPPVGTTLK